MSSGKIITIDISDDAYAVLIRADTVKLEAKGGAVTEEHIAAACVRFLKACYANQLGNEIRIEATQEANDNELIEVHK